MKMSLFYSVKDILNNIQLSMLLEVSGYPKPGNVHRTRDFIDTHFEHFLVGGVVIRDVFQSLCNHTLNIRKKNEDYSQIQLGKYILQAVQETNKWQYGGNVNLGEILLLIPLCAAVCILVERSNKTINDVRIELDKVIKNSTYKDTINLYKAIEIANPGGMGEINEFDINNISSLEKIKSQKINLYQIFDISKHRDSIAMEWVSKFKITFELGVPFFLNTFQESRDINTAIVNTFLKIASEIPDTLIIRQSGKKYAKKYSQTATKILAQGGILNPSNKIKLFEWEKRLMNSNLKINPGTTADLTASTIFISLLSGIRF